jgi:hypothetical protein
MNVDVEAIQRTSRVSWPASSSSVLPAFWVFLARVDVH